MLCDNCGHPPDAHLYDNYLAVKRYDKCRAQITAPSYSYPCPCINFVEAD